MRVAIIGGGAAGMSCASRIKALKPDAQVSVFEKTSFVSHAPCGIPYFLAGLSKLSDLMHYPPSFFVRERGIDLHLNSEVIEIENGELRVREERGERKYFWDFLVFATGALPKVPPVEGVELEGVLLIHHPSEAERAAREVERAEKIAVIGAGYLGVELAEALSSRGKKVSVIEMFDHPLPDFDREVVEPLEREMRRRVQLFTSERVLAIEGDERAEKVITERREIPADLVLFATGVRPNVQLAERAGVKTGETGAIEVDEHMRTSIEDIYAAGDCCETRNLVTGKRSYMPLATIANKQGRVAGANIAGRNLKFPGAVGTAIAKIFDLIAARTGLSEKEAKKEGFDVFVSYVHPYSHATYYPGAERMTIKLIVEKNSGRVLGAQIIGKKGVDRRIDVLATAIQSGMSAEDLFNLDLAYSPPFSSAKDPVNVSGAVADNVLRGEVKIITPKELAERLRRGESPLLLDVRSEKEVKKGMIKGALNIPLDELEERIDELPRDREIICYCATGLRSYIACRKLVQRGFRDVKNLTGSWESWIYDDLKVFPGS